MGIILSDMWSLTMFLIFWSLPFKGDKMEDITLFQLTNVLKLDTKEWHNLSNKSLILLLSSVNDSQRPWCCEGSEGHLCLWPHPAHQELHLQHQQLLPVPVSFIILLVQATQYTHNVMAWHNAWESLKQPTFNILNRSNCIMRSDYGLIITGI